MELQGFLAAEQDIREASPLSSPPLSLLAGPHRSALLVALSRAVGKPPGVGCYPTCFSLGHVPPPPEILLPCLDSLCSSLGSSVSPTWFECHSSSLSALVSVESSVSAWDSRQHASHVFVVVGLKAHVASSL